MTRQGRVVVLQNHGWSWKIMIVDRKSWIVMQNHESFGKSYNRLTIETVNTFLNDSKKSKFKI